MPLGLVASRRNLTNIGRKGSERGGFHFRGAVVDITVRHVADVACSRSELALQELPIMQHRDTCSECTSLPLTWQSSRRARGFGNPSRVLHFCERAERAAPWQSTSTSAMTCSTAWTASAWRPAPTHPSPRTHQRRARRVAPIFFCVPTLMRSSCVSSQARGEGCCQVQPADGGGGARVD